MVQAFHTHIYVSVNCIGLETLVLAFWSMVHLPIVKIFQRGSIKTCSACERSRQPRQPVTQELQSFLGPLGNTTCLARKCHPDLWDGWWPSDQASGEAVSRHQRSHNSILTENSETTGPEIAFPHWPRHILLGLQSFQGWERLSPGSTEMLRIVFQIHGGHQMGSQVRVLRGDRGPLSWPELGWGHCFCHSP